MSGLTFIWCGSLKGSVKKGIINHCSKTRRGRGSSLYVRYERSSVEAILENVARMFSNFPFCVLYIQKLRRAEGRATSGTDEKMVIVNIETTRCRPHYAN